MKNALTATAVAMIAAMSCVPSASAQFVPRNLTVIGGCNGGPWGGGSTMYGDYLRGAGMYQIGAARYLEAQARYIEAVQRVRAAQYQNARAYYTAREAHFEHRARLRERAAERKAARHAEVLRNGEKFRRLREERLAREQQEAIAQQKADREGAIARQKAEQQMRYCSTRQTSGRGAGAAEPDAVPTTPTTTSSWRRSEPQDTAELSPFASASGMTHERNLPRRIDNRSTVAGYALIDRWEG